MFKKLQTAATIMLHKIILFLSFLLNLKNILCKRTNGILHRTCCIIVDY